MKKEILSYLDLRVWQKAIALVTKIYHLLKKFPKEEIYRLSNQIRRASVSIPANIAEGHARQHPKEFLQGLFIARGSLAELDTHLIVAQQLDYINPQEYCETIEKIIAVRMLLQGLINSLKSRI